MSLTTLARREHNPGAPGALALSQKLTRADATLNKDMTGTPTVVETSLPGLRLARRGKVRDVYEVDERHLLVVATDRISAFDCILPTRIPRKGEVLTSLSRFWFERLRHASPHHQIGRAHV